MIPRLLEKHILTALDSPRKLLLIYGPRQAGKTTLLQNLKVKLGETSKITYLNCDLDEDRSTIDTTALTPLKLLLSQTQLLMIDEAQRLQNPGLTLKIIHDNLTGVQVIATGSASFSLRNALSDALTGRYRDFTLYPLSFHELIASQELRENPILKQAQAEHILRPVLLTGLYPEVALDPNPKNRQTQLKTIIESYLLKDIFAFHKVRNSDLIINLTKALAYQVGSEVNDHGLAKRLGIDRKTVANYLDLLIQSYVIVRIPAFSHNPRREIGRNFKVFFIDIGIRNSLTNYFNPLDLRSDIGSLWENFFIMERLKLAANTNRPLSGYFWRTYSGAEVDWIEQQTDKISAFECKYEGTHLSRGTHSFSNKYHIPVQLINRNTYLNHLIP